MRNFLNRLGNAFARFMYGRNGSDELNTALLVVYLVVWLVSSLAMAALPQSKLVSVVFNALSTVLFVALFWRTFSKDLAKRRAENQKFLNWWYPIKNKLAGAKARRQDKTHKYFTCKSCKTICRVPAGKGKIEITCPKCGSKIRGKS